MASEGDRSVDVQPRSEGCPYVVDRNRRGRLDLRAFGLRNRFPGIGRTAGLRARRVARIA